MATLDPYWQRALDQLVDEDLETRVEAIARDANVFGYDRWGGSKRSMKHMLAVVKWLYRNYFRAEVHGIERVPHSKALLIGNHSTQFAYDGMLVGASMILDADPPRRVTAMIEHFFARGPYLSVAMPRLGQLIGIPENCRRILTEEPDGLVIVFPEGARGGGRTWAKRHRTVGFSQGFMRMALETQTPIVPFGFVGEEMCLSLSQMRPLAKLFGAPYLPFMPTGPMPLPVKVHIVYGEPMTFEGTGNEDDDVVLPMVERVEREVQSLLHEGLKKRRGVFF